MRSQAARNGRNVFGIYYLNDIGAHPMFDADRPILKSEQDRLGRTAFSKSLARCILDQKDKESLVIGLNGSWGSGKTSIINLTLEELRFASGNTLDEERPVILNFSPWSYSGQDQLVYSFFRRLTSEMRKAEYFKNSDRIIYLLELYVSFFTHKPIPKVLRLKHFWAAKSQRNVEESYGWESGRDLTLVKAELNELLAQQKHKIIIFIDNIPRLADNEINQIFQIIKSMGDYANTVYVLALDKEYVIGAMNRVHGGGGAEYLDKLVQLPFTIPAISKQDVTLILLDRLKMILAIVPEESWDKEYWSEMYYSMIKYFFENVRDVTRYVNTLSFGYAWVKELVNPVDFFAITALEVFEPKVYYGVRDNKGLFTDLADNVSISDAKKLAEDKLRCDEILSRAEKFPRDLLQQLLIRLFPRLRNIYEPKIEFYYSEALARKNKRISTLDVFDLYFHLSIPSGAISDAEMKAILDFSFDQQGFALSLLLLNKDKRIPQFLDAFDSLTSYNIPIENVANVISALVDSADLFPQGENTMLSCDTATRVHRIIHELLRRFTINEERFSVFSKAINKADNSIYTMVHEIKEQQKEQLESGDDYVPIEYRDFTPEQIMQLQKWAVTKIMSWVDTQRLASHPKLFALLQAWKDWGNVEECRQYVVALTQDDRGLLEFLCAALSHPIQQTMTKLKPSATWRVYLNHIDEIIPTGALVAHAKHMFKSDEFEKLREEEQLGLLIFLDLVEPGAVKIIPKTTN